MSDCKKQKAVWNNRFVLAVNLFSVSLPSFSLDGVYGTAASHEVSTIRDSFVLVGGCLVVARVASIKVVLLSGMLEGYDTAQ